MCGAYGIYVSVNTVFACVCCDRMQLVMECIAIVNTTHGYLVLCVAIFPFADLNVCYIIIGGVCVSDVGSANNAPL